VTAAHTGDHPPPHLARPASSDHLCRSAGRCQRHRGRHDTSGRGPRQRDLGEQIQSECADAGGQYSSAKSGDTTFSTCTYFDSEDHAHTDYYADGDYYYSDAPPAPSSKPGPPRLAPNPVLSPAAPSVTQKPPGSNLGSPTLTKLVEHRGG